MYATDLMTLQRQLWQISGKWMVYIEPLDNQNVPSSDFWQAYLNLIEGQITAIRVYNHADDRLLLADQEALRWLASLEYFVWRLEPFNSRLLIASAASRSRTAQTEQVPQRIEPLEKKVTGSWSRKQRQIFGLIDGSRTVEQISSLLHQPFEAVEEILDELQTMGVVQLESGLLDGEKKHV